MNNDSIVARVQNDISQYGKKGNSSLEFIGLNIYGGDIKEYKRYLFANNFNKDSVDIPVYFEGFTPIDIQRSDNGDLRMNFRIHDNIDEEKMFVKGIIDENLEIDKEEFGEIHIHMNSLREKLKIKKNILTSVGAKFDSQMRLKLLKTYYSLYRLAENQNDKGKSVIEYVSERILQVYFPKHSREYLQKISDFLLKNGYYPSLMGVDYAKDNLLVKLYFRYGKAVNPTSGLIETCLDGLLQNSNNNDLYKIAELAKLYVISLIIDRKKGDAGIGLYFSEK